VGIAQREVLARYGNWFRGDDEEFAHCLILANGQCVLLFQGLRPVTVQIEHADEPKFAELAGLLEAGLPGGWREASYQGYKFITDAEGGQAKEIAVFGVPVGGAPPASYYAAPEESEIGQLIKAIAQIDEIPATLRRNKAPAAA
jgi:hypothetical protein